LPIESARAINLAVSGHMQDAFVILDGAFAGDLIVFGFA